MAVKAQGLLEDAQRSLSEFADAVTAHRKASEVVAVAPVYKDAQRVHEVTAQRVAAVQVYFGKMGEAAARQPQRSVFTEQQQGAYFWGRVRRAVKDGLRAGVVPPTALRQFLVTVTRNPEEWEPRLRDSGFSIVEVYVGALGSLAQDAGYDGRSDPQVALDDATRELNRARQRCMDLRAALKEDTETRQRVLASFTEVFGRE